MSCLHHLLATRPSKPGRSPSPLWWRRTFAAVDSADTIPARTSAKVGTQTVPRGGYVDRTQGGEADRIHGGTLSVPPKEDALRPLKEDALRPRGRVRSPLSGEVARRR